jgi:hypothetical protein
MGGDGRREVRLDEGLFEMRIGELKLEDVRSN